MQSALETTLVFQVVGDAGERGPQFPGLLTALDKADDTVVEERPLPTHGLRQWTSLENGALHRHAGPAQASVPGICGQRGQALLHGKTGLELDLKLAREPQPGLHLGSREVPVPGLCPFLAGRHRDASPNPRLASCPRSRILATSRAASWP